MLVLGIESSCDDTAAAVLRDGREVLANVVSSQFDLHAPFGGIVPELASRRHVEVIRPVVDRALAEAGVALEDLDAVAATQGPGLVGCLLVGFTFARSLALVLGIPCVGVDHMAGHLLAVFLGDQRPAFPYVALVVSGGNTSLYRVDDEISFRHLGRTRDDAAGEAFDKVAKLLGLGYPGGPVIGRLAAGGDARACDFPRAWLGEDSLDFSFSGLKTAVAGYVNAMHRSGGEPVLADVCASFQEAVVEVLCEKTLAAARREGLERVVLGGGVAANGRLRQRLAVRCAEEGLALFLPAPILCTDNAAMIALAGFHLLARGERLALDDDVYSRSSLG